MGVRYVSYGSGKTVSRAWGDVLRAADRHGVRFHVTSGHRTMKQQWALYRQNMVRPGVPKPERPLTAFPSPWAPHIRIGRRSHALDINALDGGETRLQRYLEKRGLDVSNPVPGEAWHMEVPEKQLVALAKRIRKNQRAIAKRKARKRK